MKQILVILVFNLLILSAHSYAQKSDQASKALQAMRMTCNHDNLVRFRVEAQKLFIMFWIIYLLCAVYCVIKLQKSYKNRSLDGVTGVSPGLDALMIVLLSPVLAIIDVSLTWIRLYKEAEESRRNQEKIL